jgi:hypothetical protein
MAGKSGNVCKTLNSSVKITSVAKVEKPTHSLRGNGTLTFKNKMEHELFHKWEPVINKYKNSANTELEIRFGRPAAKKFDTNVGKEAFENALKALDTYKGWEAATHKKYDVYYFDGGKRLQIDEETDERDSVVKKRVMVDDFSLEGMPFDVRLGVSTEVPFEYDGETAAEQKTKERWSFVRKNLSIDLSKIQGNPDDPDCDDDMSYQIEMEIIKPSLVDSRDTGFNLIYKIFDLMKCV